MDKAGIEGISGASMVSKATMQVLCADAAPGTAPHLVLAACAERVFRSARPLCRGGPPLHLTPEEGTAPHLYTLLMWAPVKRRGRIRTHTFKHMSRISGSGPIYHSSVTDILLTSAREAAGFILSTLPFLRSQKSARKWEAAECLWTPGMGLEPAASHGPVPAHKHPTAFHFLAVMRVVRSIHVPMDLSNG